MPRLKKVTQAEPLETPVASAPAEVSAPQLVKEPVVSQYRYPELESEYVRVGIGDGKGGIKPFSPGGIEERMYQHFISLPKVPFYCPLALGELPGAWQWYQHNNLCFLIKKGVMVMLPDQIVKDLMESFQMTSESLNPLVLSPDGVVPANIAMKKSSREFMK